ncbi:Glutamate mutase sigma subunit [Methanimicrococcus sp. At1]|uniref:Glutamate mutase sigma subunit n=1 Tax=Methanimicrococcus hacksteinii TaxID=3028293 RepID=A0ABU3VPS1_9EURY|nr:methanol--corrinoid protein MtaC [Methanimicrococcus sp. At1]MDV0445408.1 Glutamate mutase sigma subunit [Methanimicrococcus sp. At1]
MLDFNKEDISDVLVRYNVAMEKTMTPDEAAEQLYPQDPLLKAVAVAIYEGEEDDVIEALDSLLDAGKAPLKLIDEALLPGMALVSELYDQGIIFLPNVMMSADAMLEGIEYCKSKTEEVPEAKGVVVCHAAEGDVHDIGKNIVAALLRADGFDVVDLGRDVPTDEVVTAAVEHKPVMITGTALMTTTMYAFKEVNDKLIEKGFNIPFACGGGAVNQEFVESYSLGVYGEEAAQAPKFANYILKNGADIGKLREEFHHH